VPVWSLGVLGDQVWLRFPELRPAIRDLIFAEVQRCLDIEAALRPPAIADIAAQVLTPELVVPIENGTAPPDLLPRLTQTIRATLAYDGPDSSWAHEELALYLLENLATDVSLAKLAAADPQLVGEVQRRWPGLWPDDEEPVDPVG